MVSSVPQASPGLTSVYSVEGVACTPLTSAPALGVPTDIGPSDSRSVLTARSMRSSDQPSSGWGTVVALGGGADSLLSPSSLSLSLSLSPESSSGGSPPGGASGIALDASALGVSAELLPTAARAGRTRGAQPKHSKTRAARAAAGRAFFKRLSDTIRTCGADRRPAAGFHRACAENASRRAPSARGRQRAVRRRRCAAARHRYWRSAWQAPAS